MVQCVVWYFLIILTFLGVSGSKLSFIYNLRVIVFGICKHVNNVYKDAIEIVKTLSIAINLLVI